MNFTFCKLKKPARIGIDDSTGLQMKGTDRKCGQVRATLYNIGDFRKCSGGYCSTLLHLPRNTSMNCFKIGFERGCFDIHQDLP